MLVAQTQPAAIHNGVSINTPGWDEQIVPTLKKRLESESKYLTKRLSATSFEEKPLYVKHSSPSRLNQFPQSPTFGVFPHQHQQHQQHSNSNNSSAGPSSILSLPRYRTKSGFLIDETRRTSSEYTTRYLNSDRDIKGNHGQIIDYLEQNQRSRYIDNSATAKSSISSSASPRIPSSQSTSRIPTRPRSKSQLSSLNRPLLNHSYTTPSPPIPPPPPVSSTGGTGIPIVKNSPRSRSRSPSKNYNNMSVAVVEPRRESLELGGSRIKEGFIKNELPPFKMNPNEALRIAEKGHEMNFNGSPRNNNIQNTNNNDLLDETRRRSISMKPNSQKNLNPNTRNNVMMERSGSSGSDRSSRRNSRPSTSSATMGNNQRGYGISTSHTGLGLGMGQPSSSKLMNSKSMNHQQRSGSTSRSPINGSSPTVGGFNAPRSASLNLLSNSPSLSNHGTPPSARLGVAAHFIPPESNYTPPKNTNWDDVVLPTVAKKLGINENERDKKLSPIETGVEEEDLAVEWDKDGTPIRWVKRKPGAKIGLGLGESVTSQNTSQVSDTTPQRTHAFSPTFEPSPDNPLHLRPKPSSTSLRNKGSSDGLELSPLRTTNGRSASLGQPISQGESSLSSMNSRMNNAYYPGSETLLDQHPNSGIQKKSSSQTLSNPTQSISRKPSLLRKREASSKSISRQESDLSLRNKRNQSNSSPFRPPTQNQQQPPQPFGNIQSGTPGTTHRITDAIYENQLARENEKNIRTNNNNNASKAKGKDDGSHGKGCGCLIM
ncbi:uncharacterized protein L201_001126 [Kwoniella dendrophila CBS 6074]|uniref:Uncharacterized protein n=1 Tax=Kwoniella dendrophila CBS 6074 TaxID=1295534 RepID=A0AAX4JMX0_9TREE